MVIGSLIPTWFRHVSAQWFAALYVALLSFGLSVLLARKMSPEVFGTYYYVLSIAALLALFQSAGFATLILREYIAPTPAMTKLTYRLPGLALGHLLTATIVLILGAMLLLPLPQATQLSCGILCFGAITHSQQVSARFKSAGEFRREAGWQIYGRTLSALLVSVVALLATPSPEAVFIAWGVGLLLTFWLYPIENKKVLPHFSFEIDAYRATMGFLWIELSTNIYHRMDIVILHRLLGDAAAVGYYAVAFRLFDGVVLLITPAALYYFRELRTSWSGTESLQRLNYKALTIAFSIGTVLAAGGYLLGPTIVPIFFGEAYATGSASVIRWLFLSFIFVVPNSVLTQYAIATNRERWYALCASFAALLNITLNVILIPSHGVEGAAWAMLATEAGLGGSLALGLFRPRHRDELRS